MKDGKRYRISRWSIFALVTAPFAVAASVIVIAALEQPHPTDVTGQGEGLHQLAAEVVRKLGIVPTVSRHPSGRDHTGSSTPFWQQLTVAHGPPIWLKRLAAKSRTNCFRFSEMAISAKPCRPALPRDSLLSESKQQAYQVPSGAMNASCATRVTRGQL